MDDVAVRLEHVHLLNRLDWLNVHLLEGGLQLLVVCAGALVDLLDLSPWCSLASVNPNVRKRLSQITCDLKLFQSAVGV